MVKVACGIMYNSEGKFLLGLRKKNLVWEFPGGKLEEGETLEECLKREWVEELNLEIDVGNLVHTSTLNNYECYFYVGKIVDYDKLEINVHEEVAFHEPGTLSKLKMFPGDKDIIYNLYKFHRSAEEVLSI